MRPSDQPGLLRGLILSNRFVTMMKDGEAGKVGRMRSRQMMIVY